VDPPEAESTGEVGHPENNNAIPASWGLLSLTALLGLVAAPPLAVAIGGVPLRVVGWGAALWAAAIALKRVLASAFDWVNRERAERNKHSRYVIAASHGLLSALTELGLAAPYLWNWHGASLPDVLAFGIGAGSAEVLYVLVLGFLTREKDAQAMAAWARAARKSLSVRFTVPLERLLAGIGHAGSRGLVWVGLQHASAFGFAIVLLAAILFAGVDGVAVYGLQRKWDWNNPELTWRLHLYFGAISVGEMTLFLALYPTVR
jgi:hypothetical protein